jgi:uncharacterized protein (TIGR03643 family)
VEISKLSDGELSEIIGLAWADDVSFEDIKKKLGLAEADVIYVMRRELKPSSFRLWRKRVSGRKTKHQKLLRNEKPSVDLEGAEF